MSAPTDDDATGTAHPAVVADAVAPTEMAGAADANTQSAYAWGLADDDYDAVPRRFTPARITALAVAASTALIATAAVIGYLHLRSREAIGPASTAAPEPITAVITPPAPPPVTITTVVVHDPPPQGTKSTPTPAPVRVTRPVWSNDYYDQQFLAKLEANGWAIWSPPTLTGWGHEVCSSLRAGEDPAVLTNRIAVQTGDDPQLAMANAVQLVNAAVQTYPRCEYGG